MTWTALLFGELDSPWPGCFFLGLALLLVVHVLAVGRAVRP